MDRRRRQLVLAATAMAAAPGLPLTRAGQAMAASTWPDRPVRVQVGYPPGQSTDVITRMWCEELGKTFGQVFVVENRPGAGGTIAASSVARAEPDGYTLLGGSGAMAIWPYAYPDLKLDPVAGFSHISRTVTVPLVLLANNDFPAKTFKDLLQQARGASQPVNYASGGIGITNHLTMEMLRSATGMNLAHIPYKGSLPALNDLMAGRISIMFEVTTTVLNFIEAKRMRPLAVSSLERVPELPDVPTVAELGYPGFEAVTWGVFSAPARTPPAIVERLNREMARILDLPSIKAQLANLGVSPAPLPVVQTNDYMKADVLKWGKVVKEADIKFI